MSLSNPSQGVARVERGRPTKLTRPLIERICKHVRAGNFLETSAFACGVTRQTLYNWLRTANAAIARTQPPDADPEPEEYEYEEQEDRDPTEEEGDPNYHGPPASNSALVTGHTSPVTRIESLCIEFLNGMEQATSEADIADMAIIAAASETDWRAAAWRTARRDRRRERDEAQKAAEPPAPEPTPQTHPHLFRPPPPRPPPPPPPPSPEEIAKQEQRDAKRRAVFVAWKKERDASLDAYFTAIGKQRPPPEEVHPDPMHARTYEAEAFRAWWKKWERDYEELSLTEAVAKAWKDCCAETAAEALAYPIPSIPSPTPPPKPKSIFVMA